MTNADVFESEDSAPSIKITTRVVIAALAMLVLIAVVGIWLVERSETASLPTDSAPEVGFARDMIVHHNQAVEMALILYDRTDNADLKAIALDIVLTQQAQIGQMQAWLALWGVPFASANLPMQWMDVPVSGQMPGMASDTELAALRSASGVEADRLFIQLMIPHHEAGIHMADAIVARTDETAVRALAESMIAGQRKEITELELLAQALDAAPPAAESTHSH